MAAVDSGSATSVHGRWARSCSVCASVREAVPSGASNPGRALDREAPIWKTCLAAPL